MSRGSCEIVRSRAAGRLKAREKRVPRTAARASFRVDPRVALDKNASAMSRHLPSVFVLLPACALGLMFSAHARAQEAENAAVYITASELADEVELIREKMGKPYDESPRLPASGVTLFELYFQAQTLLRKSDELAHELADVERSPLPDVPRTVDAGNILTLVERALVQIRRVRSELGIAEPVVRERRDTAISPTGVFSVILDTNRQLNLLLRETISSADVFEATSVALRYATSILAAGGGGASLPEVPFEDYRRPADVYGLLMECVDVVAEIAPTLGVNVLSLSSRRNIPDDIEPGHVYDVAAILVADLVLLARTRGVERVELELGAPPKHVFPSHAYQRAGVLKAQLERLRER